MPIRAHIICTAAMRGHVTNAVQSMVVPSCAPAIEYVAIPEGSSSAAPVMRPGPRTDVNRRRSDGRRLRGFGFTTFRTLTEIRCFAEALHGDPALPASVRATRDPTYRALRPLHTWSR